MPQNFFLLKTYFNNVNTPVSEVFTLMSSMMTTFVLLILCCATLTVWCKRTWIQALLTTTGANIQLNSNLCLWYTIWISNFIWYQHIHNSELHCESCLLLRYTYSPKNHVKGHRNVEIECIIITHIGTEEHSNQDCIISVKKIYNVD
jgi:hypothetical protein